VKAYTQTTFIPQFFVRKNGVDAVEFYKKAFNAIELRCFSNDDGTVHVSELEICGALFHIHEEKTKRPAI
jgi:PhnB protein